MSKSQSLPVLASFQSSDLVITPDEKHDFLMSTAEVAKGYGVSSSTVRSHIQLHPDELKENEHFIRFSSKGVQILDTLKNKQPHKVYWTKRGVIRLGMFIKSKRAIQFRNWAENLILDAVEEKKPVRRSRCSHMCDLRPEFKGVYVNKAGKYYVSDDVVADVLSFLLCRAEMALKDERYREEIYTKAINVPILPSPLYDAEFIEETFNIDFVKIWRRNPFAQIKHKNVIHEAE